jgi:hypothetical protein
MNARNQIQTILESVVSAQKGANISLCWRRKAKTKKSAANLLIEKEVCTVGRVGVNYDNIKTTIEGRETGELPSQNAGLPWGQWQMYPFLIEHKGQVYLRMTRGTSDKVTPYVQWYLNGAEVTYSQIEPYILASEKPKKSDNPVFNVKIEDMNYVGQV